MINVQRIYDAILSTASSTLGVTWLPLRKVFDPTQNDFRMVEKGYGVRHGAADPFAGAQQAFVFSHAFELVLSRRASNRDSDVDIQVVINDLYDKADSVLRQVILTRLGLQDIVLDISEPAWDTPEVLDNGGVILVSRFNIKHWLDRLA